MSHINACSSRIALTLLTLCGVAIGQTVNITCTAGAARAARAPQDQARIGVWTDVTPSGLNLTPNYDPAATTASTTSWPIRRGPATSTPSSTTRASGRAATSASPGRRSAPRAAPWISAAHGAKRSTRSERDPPRHRGCTPARDMAPCAASGSHERGRRLDPLFQRRQERPRLQLRHRSQRLMHVISANHDDDHCYESTDGGVKWVDKGQIIAGDVTGTHSSYVWFITADSWLAVSESGNGKHGTFRTTNRGMRWTSVLPAEHAIAEPDFNRQGRRDLSAPHGRHPQVGRPGCDLDPGLEAAGLFRSGDAELPLRGAMGSPCCRINSTRTCSGRAGHGHAVVHRLRAAAGYDQRHETGGRVLRWEALRDRERQLVCGGPMAYVEP